MDIDCTCLNYVLLNRALVQEGRFLHTFIRCRGDEIRRGSINGNEMSDHAYYVYPWPDKMECKCQKIDHFRDYIQQYQQFHAVLKVNQNSISMKLSNLNLPGVNSERMANSCCLRSSISHKEEGG